jgi:16S rRNA processing protein RimM
MSNNQEERTPIGKIVGAFGIKGMVKVEPLTTFESRFDVGNEVYIDNKKFTITGFQIHKNRPLVKLKGIDTMTAAEELQWKVMEAEGQPELEEDEYFIDELVGLNVVLESGEVLGKVEKIEDYPAHQIVVVGEILIPLIEEFVLNIDLEKETMTVKLLYGMRPGEE